MIIMIMDEYCDYDYYDYYCYDYYDYYDNGWILLWFKNIVMIQKYCDNRLILWWLNSIIIEGIKVVFFCFFLRKDFTSTKSTNCKQIFLDVLHIKNAILFVIFLTLNKSKNY